jgi:hypothetical protein
MQVRERNGANPNLKPPKPRRFERGHSRAVLRNCHEVVQEPRDALPGARARRRRQNDRPLQTQAGERVATILTVEFNVQTIEDKGFSVNA